MIAVELFNVSWHISVGVHMLQHCLVSPEAFCCFGAPIRDLDALLEWVLILQDLVQVLLNFCRHLVECLNPSVLQAVDECLVPTMLWS